MKFRAIAWLAGAGVLLMAPPAGAEVRVGDWQPLFRGVELATGEADADEPRLHQVKAVRVDLREPGIEFFATPANGEAPLETTSETTTEFLRRHKLQVAINANFFAPCCTPGDKDLLGLAMSRGTVVSPPAASGTGAAALVLTRNNAASILATGAAFPAAHYWTAVAGSTIVLRDGVKPEFPATAFNTTAHPRTAVGISRSGRYLILLIIDGRQPAYSDGATMDEVADWLGRFGAHHGLNLDGGGSTSLVRADGDAAVMLNSPSGIALAAEGAPAGEMLQRVQRSNGNNFGLWAKPLAGAKSANR